MQEKLEKEVAEFQTEFFQSMVDLVKTRYAYLGVKLRNQIFCCQNYLFSILMNMPTFSYQFQCSTSTSNFEFQTL